MAARSSLRVSRCVVRVVCGADQGNAFLIHSCGLFITALHVVAERKGEKVRLLTGRGNELSAEVVAELPERDTAVLRADLPRGHGLRPAPLAVPELAVPLAVFAALSPETGIVAPIWSESASVGISAIQFHHRGQSAVIEDVWTHSKLTIAAGSSGAPVFSSLDDAIVAIACAGADKLDVAFFVPLLTIAGSPHLAKVRERFYEALEATTRIGCKPNRRGIKLRCWQASRAALARLKMTRVYSGPMTLRRPGLTMSVQRFLEDARPLAVLAGVSGVGKTASLAAMIVQLQATRPVLLLRAAQFEPRSNAIQEAFAKSLCLPGSASLPDLPAFSQSPLVIIDGLNELPSTHDFSAAHITEALLDLASLLHRKNWKLLITTRSDRLDALLSIADSPLVYRPSQVDADDAAASESARQRGTGVPHIRLESFERNEFETLRRMHSLPKELPFPELRHPIVFRMMVHEHAQRSIQDRKFNTRLLLSEHIDQLVIRMHSRCPGRARDSIRQILQSWTFAAADQQPNFLDASSIAVSDEAIAEAAVAEGLLERVPGGYRYVYDEFFELMSARELCAQLLAGGPSAPDLTSETITHLAERGYSSATLARALEFLASSQPARLGVLAEHWRDALSQGTIDKVTSCEILSRVERGTALDDAKDCLPILTDEAEPSQMELEWCHRHVSYDHHSYAFSVEQLWRMIGKVAAADPHDDSYPFRLKDIQDPQAAAWASWLLTEQPDYNPLRYLIETFPDIAFAKLTAGLRDSTKIGGEKQVASFCGAVLGVYHRSFPLEDLVPALAKSDAGRELITHLAVSEGSRILALIREGRVAESPLQNARCLRRVWRARPDLRVECAEVAHRLIAERGVPTYLLLDCLPPLEATAAREDIARRFELEWLGGQATPSSMSDALRCQLLDFDSAVRLLSSRLRSAPRADLNELVLTLEGCLASDIDAATFNERVDAVITRMCKERPLSSYESAATAETLVYLATESGRQSAALHDYLEKVCRENPGDAATVLKYPLFSRRHDFLNPLHRPMLQRLVELLSGSSDFNGCMQVLRHGCERSPASELLRVFAARVYRRGQFSQWLVENFGKAGSRTETLLDADVVMLRLFKELTPDLFAEATKDCPWIESAAARALRRYSQW